MARLPFSRKRGEEQGEKTASPVQDVSPGEHSSEEGVVDDGVEDDLHRGMKPRQLSM
jgi:hypothetical protein